MVTNQTNGTLYVGVTGDLKKQIWEHKNKVVDGFTKQYDLTHLVWYEVHDDIEQAIPREKQIKRWKREWKIRLIREMNRDWDDLYDKISL